MKWLLACALVVLSGLFSSGGALAAAPSPHALVVTPSDATRVFGGKFLLEVAAPVANAHANIIPSGYLPPPAAAYARHGRLDGYLTFLGQSPAQKGPRQIFCEVDRYRSGSGPRWAVNYTGATSGSLRPGLTVSTKTVHGLGNAAYMALYTQSSSSTARYLLVLSFRRDSYLVTLIVTGPAKLSEAEVVRMAHIVDRRITGNA